MRVLVSTLLVLALVAAACGSNGSGDTASVEDRATQQASDDGDGEKVERGVVGPIDLAVYDPDNLIGDAEECVVAELTEFLAGAEQTEFLESYVADPAPWDVQVNFWILGLAEDCGVTAEIVFERGSGAHHLGDGSGNVQLLVPVEGEAGIYEYVDP